MEFTSFYDISESPLSYALGFSLVIAVVFVVLGIAVLTNKLPKPVLSQSRKFQIAWATGAIVMPGFAILMLLSRHFEGVNALHNGDVNVTEGEVRAFKFIKRDSNIAEFTLVNGTMFKTNGVADVVPRIGLPTGTIVRVHSRPESMDILKLEIESQQLRELIKASQEFKYRCVNYGECK